MKYVQNGIEYYNTALYFWLIADSVLLYRYKKYCLSHYITFKQKVAEKVILTDVWILLKATCKMGKEQRNEENVPHKKTQIL